MPNIRMNEFILPADTNSLVQTHTVCTTQVDEVLVYSMLKLPNKRDSQELRGNTKFTKVSFWYIAVKHK